VREKSVANIKRQPLVQREKLMGKLSLSATDITRLLAPPGKETAHDDENTTGSEASGLNKNGLAERKKLKKKRKNTDAIDALWGNKKENDSSNKRKKADSEPSLGTGMKKPEAEPEKIPSFLLNLERTRQYYEPDFLELCLPIVPTWPGGYMPLSRPLLVKEVVSPVPTSGARRTSNGKQSGGKSQWVGIAAGIGDPSNYKLKKDQQRKRTSSTTSSYRAPLLQYGRKDVSARNSFSFACRGRIGRGGRYVIDRISTEYLPKKSTLQKPRELYARPHPLETGQDFLDPAKTRSESGGKAGWSSKQPTLTSSQLTKIRSIYSAEDSEDEEVIVLDHPLLAKPRIEGEDKAKLQRLGGGISKDRIPKFRLQI